MPQQEMGVSNQPDFSNTAASTLTVRGENHRESPFFFGLSLTTLLPSVHNLNREFSLFLLFNIIVMALLDLHFEKISLTTADNVQTWVDLFSTRGSRTHEGTAR